MSATKQNKAIAKQAKTIKALRASVKDAVHVAKKAAKSADRAQKAAKKAAASRGPAVKKTVPAAAPAKPKTRAVRSATVRPTLEPRTRVAAPKAPAATARSRRSS